MGTAVNEAAKLIFALSIAGSLSALMLFVLKPFIRHKLSKSFQYYIWFAVLLRFILPFSFGINLMDIMNHMPNAPQASEAAVTPSDNAENPTIPNSTANDNIANNNNPNNIGRQLPISISVDNAKPFGTGKMLADNLLWIWLIGAVLSMAFHVSVFLRFMRKIRSVAYVAEVPDYGVKVYVSRFAPAPMLAGVIKPRIYLPDIEFTDGQLNNILLHELTHLRRRDVWLKWFVTLVVSVHWFNPIVYFMRRELNRACELSCDEAVIRNLDSAAKQSYGDTLISTVAENHYPIGGMSTNMCEEKKKLKERLIAIMGYRKKTKTMAVITALLAVAITAGMFAIGAGMVEKAPQPQPEIEIMDGSGKLDELSDVEEQDNDTRSALISFVDLHQLAAKGDELIFEDFNGYEGKEVGSGLYILHFEIEDGYSLLVGGGAATGKPHYATLSMDGYGEKIDIRYDDIDRFINKYSQSVKDETTIPTLHVERVGLPTITYIVQAEVMDIDAADTKASLAALAARPEPMMAVIPNAPMELQFSAEAKQVTLYATQSFTWPEFQFDAVPSEVELNGMGFRVPDEMCWMGYIVEAEFESMTVRYKLIVSVFSDG